MAQLLLYKYLYHTHIIISNSKCVYYFPGCTNSFQKPRDGYNTFTDTSTSLPLFNSIMNPPKWSEPYFDISVQNNVTALVGKSAYLSCRVRNLGNKTVCICAICIFTICITFSEIYHVKKLF